MARRRKKSRTGTWNWTAAKGRKRTRKTTTAPLRRTDTATKTVPKRSRRELSDVEKRAGVNFDPLEQALNDGIATLLKQWQTVRADQITDLTDQIEQAGGNLVAVAAVQASSRGADVLIDPMRTVAQEGISSALAEAKAQGVTVPEPDLAVMDELLSNRAQAAAAVLARSLSEAAGRKAVSLSAPVIDPPDVAKQTKIHLESLSDSWLQDMLNQLLAGSMNTGRTAVMAATDAPARYTISALLDSNTCGPCARDDGREFETLIELEAQLPFGGNKDCLGGPRCRCTGVQILDEAQASVQ